MTAHLSLKGEGKVHDALGVTTRLKAVGEDTGGVLDVVEGAFPPDLPFPAHIHRRTDEAFYVLEGEIIAEVGDQQVTAAAGSFGFVPRGTAHGFENKGTSTARILIWQTPPTGIEAFLDELSQLPPGEPDMEVLLPLMQKYDVEPVGP